MDKENSGVSDTRNLGLELAGGKYIQFVDSDDYLDPDYTEHLVDAAEEHRADLVIAPYKMVIPREMSSGRRIQEKLASLLPGETPEPYQEERGAAGTPGLQFPAQGPDGHQDLCPQPDGKAGFLLLRGAVEQTVPPGDPGAAPALLCQRAPLVGGPGVQPAVYPARRTFYAIDQPGYYYVQNPQSLVHTSLRPESIVKMKTAVFPYYKALYENLGLYEENKAAIRRYLVLASESSMPSGPLEDVVSGALEKWDDLTAGAVNVLEGTAQKHKPKN